MIKRTVVIRKKTWQPNIKRNFETQVAHKSHTAGFISPVFIVLACTAFSGLFYIYSVNQTAIKGIAIRNAEKEVARKQKENESLKIKEAELMSLYKIEEASKELNMVTAESVKYIEENQSVAIASKESKIE